TEDPVEYDIEGLVQVAINPKIQLSFATALRSILRHDPDVIMVGEIRDQETAQVAVQAALTGHLVFSTLHTNDAASGVTRLLDMGIDPYLIVSSVTCFMGQRLVRMICEHCKQPVPSEWPQVKTVYRGRGCEACQQTGYHGRRAIYELLMMTESVKELVLGRSSADALRRRAAEEGMRTMYEDGWARVKEGLTTPDEILRVTQDERSPSA
ncbi:MAG: Flp pilus assembly complex ATPase component TadA, partial [Candidatus Omnitrophica bacterium]|nr:Flp pilus assembly complex ATPase component TadA [Candidatus Omnitrophota bacterium]